MDHLVAAVQNYGWGDPAFIAELQGREPTGEPEAELWMGAHPKAPSILASTGVGLDAHIATDPEGSLGIAAEFEGLPFLAKVLASAEPLSIQTHPSAERAREGFARENAAGVAIDSPTRTYRDPNHKPELICALTPFDAKCGFRPLDATRDLAEGLAVKPLIERLAQPGPDAEVLADALAWLLESPAEAAASLTDQVAGAAAQAVADSPDGPWQVEYEWTGRLQALYPGDPGVVVALLLNHFTLAPGEALFLEAGVLHAYMCGAGIEIMANSDNVIRGGLTPKHVDTTELAQVVDTTPNDPPVQRAIGPIHTFDSPVPEFDLTRIVLGGAGGTDHYEATVTGPEILIAVDQPVTLTCGDRELSAEPGRPIWVDAADAAWRATGRGTIFRAHV